MENTIFDTDKIIQFWIESSNQKTCTPDYCSIWIEKFKNQRLWIKTLIE